MIEGVELPLTREEIMMWALGNHLDTTQSYARWHALEYSDMGLGVAGRTASLDRLNLYVTELKRIQTWADQMVIQFPDLTEVHQGPLGTQIYVAGVYIACWNYRSHPKR